MGGVLASSRRPAFPIAMRVIALLLLLVPLSAFAQSVDSTGQIVGRVMDGDAEEGLPGANVVVVGTTMGAATDIDGYFVISGVPLGTYTIVASYAGYTPQTIETVVVRPGDRVPLDISVFSLPFDDCSFACCFYGYPLVRLVL